MARPRKSGQIEDPAPAEVQALGGSALNIKRGASMAAAPKLPPSPPFWLVYVPGRWCVLGDRVRPLMQEFRLVHGSNAVRVTEDSSGRRTYHVDDAEQMLRAKGRIPLELDCDGEEYIREIAPDHWASRWTSAVPGAGHTLQDLDGYGAFLDRMIEAGKIPAATAHDIESVCGRLRHDLESEKPGSHRGQQVAAQLAVAEAALAQVAA